MDIPDPKDIVLYLIHIAAIVWGLTDCFWGWRLFKLTITLLGIAYGCVLGIFIVYSFNNDPVYLLVGCILGGISGGIVSFAIYLSGMFVLGFTFAVIMSGTLVSFIDSTWANVALIFFGLLGGIASVILTKHIVIILTSFVGAYRVVFGIGYFFGGYSIWETVFNLKLMMDRLMHSFNYQIATILLGAFSAYIQYRAQNKSVEKTE